METRTEREMSDVSNDVRKPMSPRPETAGSTAVRFSALYAL